MRQQSETLFCSNKIAVLSQILGCIGWENYGPILLRTYWGNATVWPKHYKFIGIPIPCYPPFFGGPSAISRGRLCAVRGAGVDMLAAALVRSARWQAML